MKETKPVSSCPVCGTKETIRDFTVSREDKFAITETRRKTPARYSECSFCRLMYLHDTPDYENVYSEGFYYGAEGTPEEFFEKRFSFVINLPEEKSDNHARVKRINAFIENYQPLQKEKQYTVLDIGAGMGVFLYKFLSAEKWQGTAVEPDPHASAHIQKHMPEARVVKGYLSDVGTTGKFSLITLNRVLEHIFDPVSFLKEVKKYLAGNGILYIELPDTLSFFEDGPDNEAFGYGHYHVYSPLSLVMLCNICGYEVLSVERCKEPSGKFTIYTFVCPGK